MKKYHFSKFKFKRNNFVYFDNQFKKNTFIFKIILILVFLLSTFLFKDLYLIVFGVKENTFVKDNVDFMFSEVKIFFEKFFINYFERFGHTFISLLNDLYDSIIVRLSLIISLAITIFINLQLLFSSYFAKESEEVDATKTHKIFSCLKEKISSSYYKMKIRFREFAIDYKTEIKLFFLILLMPVIIFLISYLVKIYVFSCFGFLFEKNDFMQEILWLLPVLIFNGFYYSPFILKIVEIYLLIMFVCLIFDKIKMRKISDRFDLFVQNEAIGLVRKISGKMGSGKTKFNAAVDRRIEKIFVNQLQEEKMEMKLSVMSNYNMSKYENLLENSKFKSSLLVYFDSVSWVIFYGKVISLLQNKINKLKEKKIKTDKTKNEEISDLIEIFEKNIKEYFNKKEEQILLLNEATDVLNSFDLFYNFGDKEFLFDYLKICLKLSKSLMITNYPLLSAWDTLQKNKLRFCNVLLKDDLEFVPKQGKRNILNPKTIISLDEYENVYFDEEDEMTDKEIRAIANELSIISQPTHRQYAMTVCSQKDNAINKKIRVKSGLQIYWSEQVKTRTTFFADLFIYTPLYYLLSFTSKIKRLFFFSVKKVDNYNEYSIEHNSRLRGFILPLNDLNNLFAKPLCFLNRHFQYDLFSGSLCDESVEALGAQCSGKIKVKIPISDYYQKDPKTGNYLFIYNSTNLDGIYLPTGYVDYYNNDTSFSSFNVEFEDIYDERSTYSALANQSLGLDFSTSQTKKQKRNKK